MKKSSSQANTTSNVNTTTTIRDIGLTGRDVVDAVTVLEAGAIEREQITAGSISDLASFAQTLIDRNAATAVRVTEGESDLVKLAPYIVAAIVLVGPAVFRRGK